MTDAVQIELIRAIPMIVGSMVGSIASIAAAWFSFKSSSHSQETNALARKVEANTNGITERLNMITAKASHAQGVLDEKTRAAEQHHPKSVKEKHPGEGKS